MLLVPHFNCEMSKKYTCQTKIETFNHLSNSQINVMIWVKVDDIVFGGLTQYSLFIEMCSNIYFVFI